MFHNNAESKFTINIYVDKARNKVILAEASKDFIDVLYSFLTIPMGTIARFLEERESSNPMVIGCLNNLYRSVEKMELDCFQTEACKEMLLFPRSVEEEKCRKLKVNLNDIEAPKFFVCKDKCDPLCRHSLSSNFNTSKCQCGNITDKEIGLSGGPDAATFDGKCDDDVFFDGSTMFLVTDDLRVMRSSIGAALELAKLFGFKDFNQLEETVVDVGFNEVLLLLGCLFYSNSALTDTFLVKQSSQDHETLLVMLHSLSPQNEDRAQSKGHQPTLRFLLRKSTGKILLAECGEEFADLLFTFLVIPFGCLLELSCNGMYPSCIVNLYKSFKDLKTLGFNYECMLPPYYSCIPQVLDIKSSVPPVRALVFNRINYFNGQPRRFKVVRECHLVDPRLPKAGRSMTSNGFTKREKKFVVFDDLIVKPSASTPAIPLMKKLQISVDDFEEQEISIDRAEAVALLRASLLTSSALNSAFGSLLVKKPKKET